jgi:hypothetical protein
LFSVQAPLIVGGAGVCAPVGPVSASERIAAMTMIHYANAWRTPIVKRL